MERKKESKKELAIMLIEEREKAKKPAGTMTIRFDGDGKVRAVEEQFVY